MSNRAKKLALFALLTSLTLVLSILESLLPPLVPTLPFFKMGLSNVGIVLILVVCGAPFSFAAGIIKCIVVAVYSGAFSTLLYSIPASIIAVVVMAILLKSRKFTLRFTSILGALAHITIQLIVAVFATGSISILIYAPVLLLASTISGAIVGYVDWLIVKTLPLDKTIDKKS